jgi:hypothetical protein
MRGSLIFPTELEEDRFSIGRRECTWTFRLDLITLIYLYDLFPQDSQTYWRVWNCIIATVYNMLSHAPGVHTYLILEGPTGGFDTTAGKAGATT